MPQRLPLLGGDGRVHVGVVLAVVGSAGGGVPPEPHRVGLPLRVVGGNPEAARRAGLRVGSLLVSAMVVGGALAGLGGVIQLAGVEFKLRPRLPRRLTATSASWPAGSAATSRSESRSAAILLSAIVIGGDSLQIDSGLPAASVNVLMALLLLAVFGWTGANGGAPHELRDRAGDRRPSGAARRSSTPRSASRSPSAPA